MSDPPETPQLQELLSRTREPGFLYQLLPAYLRRRDLDVGLPLRALMQILEGEYRAVADNIARLDDEWFIATCDEWAVPYIGEAIGVSHLEETRDEAYSQRGFVANTIAYRRSKGTVATLARAVHDATGWGVFPVQFFRLLGLNQSVRHLRLDQGRLVDVRDFEALEQLERPWTTTARTVSVTGRPASDQLPLEGGPGALPRPAHFNIPVVGLFLFRLLAYPVQGRDAHRLTDTRFTFHPLGLDVPLYELPRTEPNLLETPSSLSVPRPLTREHLSRWLDRLCRGEADPPLPLSVALRRDHDVTVPLRLEHLVVADLQSWGARFTDQQLAAIDPELGRLELRRDLVEREPGVGLEVGYAYGFSGDMGGGPYERSRQWRSSDEGSFVALVGRELREPGQHQYPTLEAALQAWAFDGRDGIVVFTDSHTYALPPDRRWAVALPQGRKLTLVTDVGATPVLVGDLVARGEVPLAGQPSKPATLTLDGLLLDGTLDVHGAVHLLLRDSTLVPPRHGERPAVSTSLLAGELPSVRIEKSIVGPLHVGGRALVHIEDSIVDPGASGAALRERDGALEDGARAHLERTTLFGEVRASTLAASSCLFCRRVEVARTSEGHVRYSYLPEGSRVPATERCQPQTALAGAHDEAEREAIRLHLAPVFASAAYGQPGYAQLGRSAAEELLTGGAQGNEMGAFYRLRAPQRWAALIRVVEEYQPQNLTTDIVFVT